MSEKFIRKADQAGVYHLPAARRAEACIGLPRRRIFGHRW